ncbi:hypothetical protein [Xanthomonas sp.]|uniref:hypothetical protein n=1 Tax=Xanthomonas sp. TaxID=29446 RepID=UPI00197CFD05|nr:hypothetical protein [Xanthomonas sp.]
MEFSLRCLLPPSSPGDRGCMKGRFSAIERWCGRGSPPPMLRGRRGRSRFPAPPGDFSHRAPPPSQRPGSASICALQTPTPDLRAHVRPLVRVGADPAFQSHEQNPSLSVYPQAKKQEATVMKHGIVRQVANLALQLDSNPEHVYRWITEEQVPAFDDRRPIELIWEDKGELVLSFLSDLIDKNMPSRGVRAVPRRPPG